MPKPEKEHPASGGICIQVVAAGFTVEQVQDLRQLKGKRNLPLMALKAVDLKGKAHELFTKVKVRA